MDFKPSTWRPIAIALAVINLLGAGYAVATGESQHAAVHAVLLVAFGVWAQHLRQAPRGNELEAGLDALEGEMSNLRQELSETQERLDFTERMLAQRPDPLRVDQQRQEPKP
jgi:hypothetical protein